MDANNHVCRVLRRAGHDVTRNVPAADRFDQIERPLHSRVEVHNDQIAAPVNQFGDDVTAGIFGKLPGNPGLDRAIGFGNGLPLPVIRRDQRH